MTEDELEAGRLAYEQEAKNWPSPIGWDKLMYGSKVQWAQRASGKVYSFPSSRKKPV